MSVLNDILEWSQKDSRPKWQRDALRRLVEKGELTEQDISELTEICKNVHGLGEQREAIPLSKNHIPKPGEGLSKVVLTAIFHKQGVNALAENQTLDFKADGLTVVYGANAAGKTGYTRILKTACRTRGREEILGNVFASETHTSPEVAIRYQVGDNPEQEWLGNEDDNISRVSVFDAKSAAVYLNEKTDVAFRPLGLDLFDKLVQACKDVNARLSKEKNSFASENQLLVVQTEVPEGTTAAKRLSEISDRTKPEEFEELARLSSDEEAQLASLEKTFQALKADDPDVLIRKMKSSTQCIRELGQQLQEVEDKLSEDALSDLYTAKSELLRKNEEAKKLQEKMFSAGYLTGTGLEKWLELWKSARKFSEESAYPSQTFPVVEDDAQCVLCQQHLDHNAGQRLLQFQEFVKFIVETELQELRKKLDSVKTYLSLSGITIVKAKEEIIKEIHVEDKDTGDAVLRALEENEKRCEAVSASLNDKSDTRPPSDLPKLIAVADKVENLAQRLDKRLDVLCNKPTKKDQERVSKEMQELQARKILFKYLPIVLAEIARIKKCAKYDLCIKDTATRGITTKSADVTEKAVTEALQQNFKQELKKLYPGLTQVEIKIAGGREGVLYHKLILSGASKFELQHVASEGEQRCLSIAAFLAELSIADERSGIVFDDPVSSLDYEWRQKVAQRLVAEAEDRQVIVFTHDIVFLCFLNRASKEKHVSQHNMRLEVERGRARASVGICEQELPWIALSVNERIKWLNKQSEAVAKQYKQGDQSGYEKEAFNIYRLLRETWERAVEEILLNSVVERFRFGVETQRLRKIADITPDDCGGVEAEMTKCSQLLHDAAPAAGVRCPDPDELKADIGKLKDWVKDIRRRREH